MGNALSNPSVQHSRISLLSARSDDDTPARQLTIAVATLDISYSAIQICPWTLQGPNSQVE